MPSVVVVGGANVDIKARSAEAVLLHTSNPGTASTTAGGVGRNVAENLARLGTPTMLVSAVGADAFGDHLLATTAGAGVDVSRVRRVGAPTGTYTALLDHDGELVAAVAAMGACDAITPELVAEARDVVEQAGLLVLDGNLPAATVAAALDLAGELGVRVVVDPVSVPKAQRLLPVLSPGRPLWMLTPDRGELGALSNQPVSTREEVVAAAEGLHLLGVEIVWARLGLEGSYLSGPFGRVWLDAVETRVVDVTGAGDAMVAAFCHFELAGADVPEAARLGHAAAALTVGSEHTVLPELSDEVVSHEHRTS
jgi:pseudouridine kinase